MIPLTTMDRLAAKRAIEALRSGVPSRDAVRALGSRQVEIEERFLSLLQASAGGEFPGGVLFGGDFGTGKSHVLERLRYLAGEQGFVASKVVISKETPIHDPVKVLRTAVHSARAPGVRGSALRELAQRVFHNKEALRKLRSWAESASSGLDDRFAATLFLFDNSRSDMDFVDRVVRFWGGDPISVADLKRGLKAAGEPSTYALGRVTVRDLAVQRFRFAARLMQAAGAAGWVLLFDELELIGQYSLLQRARSYAEITRWLDGSGGVRMDGFVTAMAISDDFDGAVLVDKGDYDKAPNRLRDRNTPEDTAAATRAERGMRLISSRLHMEQPTRQDLENTYVRVRKLHEMAYDWVAPMLSWEMSSVARPMRQYVRPWIHQWDLHRLDPAYQPDILIDRIASNYHEEAALEEEPADLDLGEE